MRLTEVLLNDDGPITLCELLILIGRSLMLFVEADGLRNLSSFLLSLKLLRISKYRSEAPEEFKSKLSRDTSRTGLYLSVALDVLSYVKNWGLLVFTESMKFIELVLAPLLSWVLNWLKFDFVLIDSLWMNGRTSLLWERSLTRDRKSDTCILLLFVWNPLFCWIFRLAKKSFDGSMHYRIKC